MKRHPSIKLYFNNQNCLDFINSEYAEYTIIDETTSTCLRDGTLGGAYVCCLDTMSARLANAIRKVIIKRKFQTDVAL